MKCHTVSQTDTNISEDPGTFMFRIKASTLKINMQVSSILHTQTQPTTLQTSVQPSCGSGRTACTTPRIFTSRRYNQSYHIPVGGQSRKPAVGSWWLCQALAIGRWGHTGPQLPATHVSGSQCHQKWPSHDDHDYGWSWSQPGELTDAGSAGQTLSAETLTMMASP